MAMTDARKIEKAVRHVDSQASFIQDLLIDALGWEIDEGTDDVEDISFEWSGEEVRADGLDKHIVDGVIRQIRPIGGNPWGIFILEFKRPDIFTTGRGMTGILRTVLRGLVPSKRKKSSLANFRRENLLFICNHRYKHFRFAHFKAPAKDMQSAPLAAFGWGPGDPIRTLCEFNLNSLEWPDRALDAEAWVTAWGQAFDVEKVTKRFYEDYAAAFAHAEKLIAKQKELKGDELRMFTQTLFNRLMFLRFMERKGWLTFNDRHDYLRALHDAGPRGKKSFFNGRLCPLFFEGLAKEGKQESDAYGSVPYLNGGLFERSTLDRKVTDLPDAVFDGILGSEDDGGLFYRYNFTIEESTPLDIEVAVDPEMLGKVFEELVTGRHETGSYYTPRPVVSFMCREALKGLLADTTKAPTEAVTALVDHQDAGKLKETHAREILATLDDLKAVDPACGSGAYLLGLMQEMISVYRQLYSERLIRDSRSLYELKLRIISQNLYGVDIDPFATNIAMLRLWLSLAVEADEPLALPNLDFKIETGDSLLAPNPQDMPDLFRAHLQQSADVLTMVKKQFFLAHGTEKEEYRRTIVGEEKRLRDELASELGEGIVDWRIQFAEAFANKRGGFDIVLANPPYVRQELIKGIKARLKDVYDDDYSGTADLYCFFYLRGLQLLRRGGMLAFISSNKWLRAAYGAKLRVALSDRTQVLQLIDFGDAPIFTAVAYPCIVVLRRSPPGRPSPEVLALTWKAGDPIGQFVDVFRRDSFPLGQSELKHDGWRIETPANLRFMERLRAAGKPLGECVEDRVYRGITTGLNEAFVIDGETRRRLIAEDKSSAKVTKPFARGRDVERWVLDSQDQWLLFTRRGMDIKQYPAVLRHLKSFKQQLLPGVSGGRKPGSYEWFEIQDNIAYWRHFERAKIVSTKVSIRPTFAYDESGSYLGNTAYFFAVEDGGLYLLALLNSNVFQAYAKRTFVEKQNGWYEVQPEGLESFPIPLGEANQREACELLVSYVIWLTRNVDERGTANESRDTLMRNYFEQLLNGLAYELYFPDDLHAHGLQIFDLVKQAQLPQLHSIAEAQRMGRLRQLFEALYSNEHPLRGALHSLLSLETVRLVEGHP